MSSFLSLIKGKRVKYMCDNSGVVSGCRKHYTGIDYLFPYVAAYTNLSVCHQTFENIVYIPTPPKKTATEHTVPENWRSDDNRLADSLSRDDLADFLSCCEYYKPNKYSGQKAPPNHIQN